MPDAARERILLDDGAVKQFASPTIQKMRATGTVEGVGARWTVTGADPVAGAAGAAGAVGHLTPDGGTIQLRSAEEIDLFKVIRNTAAAGAIEFTLDQF